MFYVASFDFIISIYPDKKKKQSLITSLLVVKELELNTYLDRSKKEKIIELH